MQQIQNFIKFRDEHVDHQLFGAKQNHRDLIVFQRLCDAEGAAIRMIDINIDELKPHFRNLLILPTISVQQINNVDNVLAQQNTEPSPIFIPCTEQEIDKKILLEDQSTCSKCAFIITLDGVILEPKAKQDSDGVLAEPRIDSDKQVVTLLGPGNRNNRTRGQFVDLFAQWLQVRAPPLKRRRENMGQVVKFIDYNSNQSDDRFWQALYRYLYRRDRPQPEQNPPPNSLKRQQKRIDELKEALPAGWKPSSILDIGCSDGFILEQFGEAFGVQKENLLGLDIRPPVSEKISFLEGSGEKFYDQLEGKFSLVTISMTLHHIPHYKAVLQNVKRYLAPGGILFIREHDAYSNDYKLYLDLHDQAFNSALWEKPESPHAAFVQNCRSWFLARKELTDALAQIGLKPEKLIVSKDTTDWNVHGRVWWGSFKQ